MDWASKRFTWVYAKSQLRLKYRFTALGALWNLLEPLLYLSVLSAVFSYFNRMRLSDHAVFLFSAIHEPVKHYSSGMYARLAFALAFDVEPDVLLVDEVFGVGDEFFTEKCLARIHALVSGGVTSVFISHNLDFLQAECSRLVWLERGRLVMDGPPAIVAGAYRERRGVFED